METEPEIKYEPRGPPDSEGYLPPGMKWGHFVPRDAPTEHFGLPKSNFYRLLLLLAVVIALYYLYTNRNKIL